MTERKERIFLKGFKYLPPFLLLLALLLPALQAQAANRQWVGESSWWDFAWNWGPSGQPQDGDNVYLTQSDAMDRTVWYWNTAYPSAVLYTLRIDAIGTGTMTFSQDRDTLSSQSEHIGDYGTGSFTQSGGTNTVSGGLYLGVNPIGLYYPSYPGHSVGSYYSAGSSGTYDLSGTGSLSAGTEYIGYNGTGSFTQSGGTNAVTNVLYLGEGFTGSGTYDLSGGSLSADHEEIGTYGTGSFTQTGGTNTVRGDLSLGDASGGYYSSTGYHSSTGSGTYDLSGTGSISASTEYIGNFGTGSFTQSGGTHTVTSDLYLGYRSTASGTYDLSGTGSLWANGEYIGFSGTGSFTQSGGMHTVTNGLYLGYDLTASGAYDLSGTGSLSASTETIGYTGTGSFTQNGGTHTVTNGLYLGYRSTGSGTYNLSGGSLSAGSETIGLYGTGSFTQSGGTNTVSGELRVDGTYQLTGGDVTASDWTIGPTGTVTGGVGGLFKAGHSFSNHSLQNTSWDTDLAELVLSGSSMTMDLAGADYGADSAGYTDNFAWGIFHIGSALTDLTISDGVTSNSGAALYVGLFKIDGGLGDLGKIFSDFNIYYDADLPGNGWLGDQSYALNGSGFLMPVSSVPEPTSMLLIGTALIGLIGRGRTKRNAA